MTIRYTCTECGSVLKIKDEKAGTNAKCPKCKIAFVVPTLDEAWDGELEFEAPAESEQDSDDEPLPAASRDHTAREKSVAASSAVSRRRSAAADEDDFGDDDDHQAHDAGTDEEDDRDAEEVVDRIELPDADSSADDAPDDFEDPDMPLELTPAAPVSDDFDPTGLLGNEGSSRSVGRRRSVAPADRKASVADLMKDFDAAKKKDRKTSETDIVAAPVAAAQTAGTAAEALSRAYQQKRENASNPSPKKVKENIQRQLLFEYLRRTVPPIAVALVLSWALYSFVNRRVYTGAPLAPVSGQLTRSGTPLVGYQVRLVPVLSAEELNASGGKGSPPGRSTASGVTNDKGEFTMMYTISDRGASIGDHTLEVMEPSGIGVRVPPEYEQQSVPADGIKSLRIDLP